MFRQIDQWFATKANIKTIALFGILFILIYTVLNSSIIYILNQYGGHFNNYIYNLQLCYTPEFLYQSLHHLNIQLIKFHPYFMLLDLLVLICYAFFGTLLLRRLIFEIKPFTKWVWLSYVFIFAAGFNIVEDILFIIVFKVYPVELPTVVRIASLFTFAKLFCLAVGILLSIGALVIVIYRYLKRRSIHP